MRFLGVALALILSASACGACALSSSAPIATAPLPTPEHMVVIYVYTASGRPIQGAEVTGMFGNGFATGRTNHIGEVVFMVSGRAYYHVVAAGFTSAGRWCEPGEHRFKLYQTVSAD